MKKEYLLLKNSLEKYIADIERRRNNFYNGYIEDIVEKNEKIGIKIDDEYFIEEVFRLKSMDWETHHKNSEIWVWFDIKYLERLRKINME